MPPGQTDQTEARMTTEGGTTRRRRKAEVAVASPGRRKAEVAVASPGGRRLRAEGEAALGISQEEPRVPPVIVMGPKNIA